MSVVIGICCLGLALVFAVMAAYAQGRIDEIKKWTAIMDRDIDRARLMDERYAERAAERRKGGRS